MARVFLQETDDSDAIYMLQRAPGRLRRGARPEFLVWHRFRYVDRGRDRTFTVPREVGCPDVATHPCKDHARCFTTDLASVPGAFTWLVPRDGSHTPAAILHDALVRGADEGEGSFYVGPAVTREEADTVFREAMVHLEVPLLRRWLMWAAVSLATLWSSGRWWWRFLIVVTIAVLGVGAVLGSLDLYDIVDVELPGMPQDGMLVAALWLLAVSLAAALVTAVVWFPRSRLGLVVGLGLVLLGFPLFVCGIAYLGYNLVEYVVYLALRLKRRWRPDEVPEPITPPPMAR